MPRILTPQLHLYKDFLIAFKPKGLTTHQSNPETPGFTEYLEMMLGEKLYVVHRLDRETSGLLLLARSQNAAAKLTSLFLEKKIYKEYLLITSSLNSQDQIHTVESHIIKEKKIFRSLNPSTRELPSKSQGPPSNALTRFELLETEGEFALWKALPATGKPHQIRLHSLDRKRPLLGDPLYGGDPFPFLTLTASRLRFTYEDETIDITSPLPSYFKDLNKLSDPYNCFLEEQWQRRQFLYNFKEHPSQTLRLLHTENSKWRADSLGDVLWIHWFSEQPPTSNEMKVLEQMQHHLQKPKLAINHLKRQKEQMPSLLFADFHQPSRWLAQEENRSFEFRTQAGLSPGLFLDQRENRNFIQNHSRKKCVLNLFSYTGGFSVAAALGGASEVVSVDLSKTFLEWSKENFKHNGLDPSQYEFHQKDTLSFLRIAVKKQRQFDLIICDPPSFSRNKEGVFRIEKNMKDLVFPMLLLLSPNGQVLFSTNYETWTLQDFFEACKKILPPLYQVQLHQNWSFDFELPGAGPVMKTLLIKKCSEAISILTTM